MYLVYQINNDCSRVYVHYFEWSGNIKLFVLSQKYFLIYMFNGATYEAYVTYNEKEISYI